MIDGLRKAALRGSADDLVVYADWLEERQLTWTLCPDPEAFELDVGRGCGYGWRGDAPRYGDRDGGGAGGGGGSTFEDSPGYGYGSGNGHGGGTGFGYNLAAKTSSSTRGAQLSVEAAKKKDHER